MKQTQRRTQRRIRTVTSLGFLALAVATSIAVSRSGDVYDYQDSALLTALPQVDVIVCLGGGRGRVAEAGEVWHRYWERSQTEGKGGKPPILYFSGMGRGMSWHLLSKQLRRSIAQEIEPAENVVIEKESLNTDANARWLQKYATERNWKRILLLTSTYHMKRASFIFGQILKSGQSQVEIETYSVHQEPFSATEWWQDANGIRVTVSEYFKWLYYRYIWVLFSNP